MKWIVQWCTRTRLKVGVCPDFKTDARDLHHKGHTVVTIVAVKYQDSMMIQMGDSAEIQMGIQHTKHHLNRPFSWIVGSPPESLQLFESQFTQQQFNSPIKYADQIVLHNLNDSFNLWTHCWQSECTANSMMIPSCESSMNHCLNQLLDPHTWLPLIQHKKNTNFTFFTSIIPCQVSGVLTLRDKDHCFPFIFSFLDFQQGLSHVLQPFRNILLVLYLSSRDEAWKDIEELMVIFSHQTWVEEAIESERFSDSLINVLNKRR